MVRSGEQYTVTYTAEEGPVEEVFDSVVLATPLHDAGIEFDLDVTEHMSPYQVNTLCEDMNKFVFIFIPTNAKVQQCKCISLSFLKSSPFDS